MAEIQINGRMPEKELIMDTYILCILAGMIVMNLFTRFITKNVRIETKYRSRKITAVDKSTAVETHIWLNPDGTFTPHPKK